MFCCVEKRLEGLVSEEPATLLGWFSCRAGAQLTPSLREQVRSSLLRKFELKPFSITPLNTHPTPPHPTPPHPGGSILRI